MTLYRFCWGIAFGLCVVLFRLRVEGQGRVPRCGGAILASNHAAYPDPVFIGVAAGRELFYVTKQEVFPVPFLGWFIRKLNALPIDRSRGDRSGLLAIEARLKSGGAMFLSPEGTRNKSERLLAPKAGVGMLAYRASVPVVPVYIFGTKNVWKSLVGLSRVVVRFGEPISFHSGRLPERRRDAYQSISCEVMRQIRALKQRRRPAGPPAPVANP